MLEPIKSDLQSVIGSVFGLKKVEISLTFPSHPFQGDVSTNVALAVSESLKQSPMKIAEQVQAEFASRGLGSEYLDRLEVIKPGFLNFFLTKNYLHKQLEDVLGKGKSYGHTRKSTSRLVMVEFAHPNTHKLVHIGHLRNMCLGESLCRLLPAVGVQVVRANYQGDVGLHVAKCLWGILQRKGEMKEGIDVLGKAYVEGNKAYENSPEGKKEISAINEKIYSQSDREIIKLWEKTRQWSLVYLEAIYQRLGVSFDRYYFESEVYKRGKDLVLAGLEKGIFEKSEGAIIFDGEKYGLHKRVFITQKGIPVYEAKDMALGELQFKEYSLDTCLHVVAREQEDYFRVVFKALEKLFPHLVGKERHLSYGWVSLKSGKMSSREGGVVLAEDILDRAVDLCHSEKVGVGAVKYNFLKYASNTDIVFDVEQSVALEGNSGPYIQYAYTRCKSILRKQKNIKTMEEMNQEERRLLLDLGKFPSVVQLAAETYSPHLICNYLFELAQDLSVFYENHQVIGGPSFRLRLVAAVASVLENGLDLLGIDVVEEM